MTATAAAASAIQKSRLLSSPASWWGCWVASRASWSAMSFAFAIEYDVFESSLVTSLPSRRSDQLITRSDTGRTRPEILRLRRGRSGSACGALSRRCPNPVPLRTGEAFGRGAARDAAVRLDRSTNAPRDQRIDRRVLRTCLGFETLPRRNRQTHAAHGGRYATRTSAAYQLADGGGRHLPQRPERDAVRWIVVGKRIAWNRRPRVEPSAGRRQHPFDER
jgi:hypothetical protein